MSEGDYLYYKKVEITGINTSELSVLSDEESNTLFEQMKNGDKSARDKLVKSNIKLVLSIIQKVNIRNSEPDDLFQVGCMGLLKALNNFNPELNIKFSTYGVVMILGEIKRYIRDNQMIKVSRSTKDLAYRALAFKEKYVKENECEPSINLIAEQLGTTAFKVGDALEAISPSISLYEPAFDNESEGVYLLDQIRGDNFEDEFAARMVIKDVLKSLKSREKDILRLRFIQGKTQTQVSAMIGISQAQVSRIEKNILSVVKRQLEM